MNGVDRLAERLLHTVKEAQGRLDEKDPAGAEALLREAIAEAAKGGIRSAHATWLLAIAHDHQGELEAAFEAITRTVALDPLEPAAWRAKAALARRMGDEAAASEAEAMAAATAPEEPPFGVPGLAEA